MTDQPQPLTAESEAVLEVLTNEGWVADPEAIEYNLRLVGLVLRAARAAQPSEGLRTVVERLIGAGMEIYVASEAPNAAMDNWMRARAQALDLLAATPSVPASEPSLEP